MDLSKYKGKSRSSGQKTYIHFKKGSSGYSTVMALRAQGINVNLLVADLLATVVKGK